MKQTTLFGGVFGDLEVELGTNDNLLLSGVREQINPNVRSTTNDIEENTRETFQIIKSLVPELEHELITTTERLDEYLESIKKTRVYAIDTETDGLNPRTDKIAGISLYTPGESAVYIPINHHFYENNVDAREFVRKLSRLKNVRVIMHNSKFDSRVLHNYAQVWLMADIDTMIAAHVLNENEPKGLKALYNKYCVNGRYVEATYGSLFSGRKFNTMHPEQVYIYATFDPYMTFELAKFQMKYLKKGTPENKQYGLEGVSHVFTHIEMPVVHIATFMEERGIGFDYELNLELQKKYEKQIKETHEYITNELDKILKEKGHLIPAEERARLPQTINIDSGDQLTIILYSALGFKQSPNIEKAVIQRKKKTNKAGGKIDPRSVGVESLEYFAEAYPEYKDLMEAILDYRASTKIYSTYITGLRKEVDPYSKRIHGGWNTVGTHTGRMSSSKPNLYKMEVIKFIKLLEHLARS